MMRKQGLELKLSTPLLLKSHWRSVLQRSDRGSPREVRREVKGSVGHGAAQFHCQRVRVALVHAEVLFLSGSEDCCRTSFELCSLPETSVMRTSISHQWRPPSLDAVPSLRACVTAPSHAISCLSGIAVSSSVLRRARLHMSATRCLTAWRTRILNPMELHRQFVCLP